ncbi:MAG: sigma-70 family RNA polymerase sigma factor [Ignavibacteria bacterium]|nr:sigma-70 family RNA polymerase sigma factor [Ignavibacteria bacterium]
MLSKKKIKRNNNSVRQGFNDKLLSEFKEFVFENKDKSFSLCFRILKDTKDAEDALQESFLRFYRALREKKFNFEANVKTYFYKIVYNTTVEFYRKRKLKNFNIKSFEIYNSHYREGNEFTSFDEYISNLSLRKNETEKIISSNEVKKIISDFLNLLPEHYSTILTMNYINELSLNEISEILNIPLGTVKNRIFRAKEKLKDVLLNLFTEKELLEYLNSN